jgi:uncharacterized protein (TIGR00106 family)
MLASFTIVPLDAGPALKEHVARILDLVDRSGLPYRLGAMQTTVEGDLDRVMALIRECHLLAARHSTRVLTTITLDDRRDARGRLEGKVADVESVLGRSLRRE